MELLDKKHFNMLKALAILGVVVGHIGNYAPGDFTPLGGIGVVLFLFCSGYGLYISYTKDNNLKDFWKKRIISVWLAYAIIEIIAAIFLHRDFGSLILDLALIKPLHPYRWYMQYIFGCYVIFWVVFKFVKKQSLRIVLLLIPSIVSFFVFTNLQGEQALSFVGGVLIGMYFHKVKDYFNKSMLIGFSLLLISIVLLAIKQIPMVSGANHYLVTLINLIFKDLAALALIFLSYAFRKTHILFKHIGNMSFSLYLVHGYFMPILADNIFKNTYLNIVIFVVISFGLSFVFQKIIDYISKKLKDILIYKKRRISNT